ncbi:hypothetical protein BJ875DRAFT_547677 [Amylocarpus encephaloides]|uniref:Uncharacterized protein n=1 Tax=Amylocarpus encephaloides TaxID=45428 RepID=A0A9P8C0W3_9HELO|nr:hypothetical protein BJ875DRAFT_547677 [Amylocarpus encephaloides]
MLVPNPDIAAMVSTVQPSTSSSPGTMNDVFLVVFWGLQSTLVLAFLAFTSLVLLLLAAKSDPTLAFISWILFLILALITLPLTSFEVYCNFSTKGLDPQSYLLLELVKPVFSLAVWTAMVIGAVIATGEHSLGTENLAQAGVVSQIPFIIPFVYAARYVAGAGNTGEEDLLGDHENDPLLGS